MHALCDVEREAHTSKVRGCSGKSWNSSHSYASSPTTSSVSELAADGEGSYLRATDGNSCDSFQSKSALERVEARAEKVVLVMLTENPPPFGSRPHQWCPAPVGGLPPPALGC